MYAFFLFICYKILSTNAYLYTSRSQILNKCMYHLINLIIDKLRWRRHCDTFHFNISPAASCVNVNSCIVFLKERKIYKVKWHDTMPPVTFTSVINISSSSLFQVSHSVPRGNGIRGGERWLLGLRRSTQLVTSPRHSFFHYIPFSNFERFVWVDK